MLSPNLLKSQIPMSRVGGRDWQPNFDADSKFAKIPNSHVGGGGGGGEGGGGVGSQLLMWSPNLLKSKKKFPTGLAENFLSFRAKKCLGMVLDFEYQMATIKTVNPTSHLRCKIQQNHSRCKAICHSTTDGFIPIKYFYYTWLCIVRRKVSF